MQKFSTMYHWLRVFAVNFVFILFFPIKRINWKCKNLVKCTRTYIRILLLLLEVVRENNVYTKRWVNTRAGIIRTTSRFNFYYLLVTTYSESWAPDKRYIRIFWIRWTMNQQACTCLLHQCLPMPASACQNLYIVRWTRIYIRLLIIII